MIFLFTNNSDSATQNIKENHKIKFQKLIHQYLLEELLRSLSSKTRKQIAVSLFLL